MVFLEECLEKSNFESYPVFLVNVYSTDPEGAFLFVVAVFGFGLRGSVGGLHCMLLTHLARQDKQ